MTAEELAELKADAQEWWNDQAGRREFVWLQNIHCTLVEVVEQFRALNLQVQVYSQGQQVSGVFSVWNNSNL